MIILKNPKIILSWVLVLAVMILIFSFSAQGADTSNDVSGGFISAIYKIYLKFTGVPCSTGEFEATVAAMQHTIRKLAHFSIYLILGFLFSNAYYQSGFKKFSKYIPLAFVSSAVYASTDEFHQLFVSGRSGELRDVLIDSSGAFLGILIFTAIIIIGRKLWISKKPSKI